MNSNPTDRGSQEAGFTQPRDHLLADPCSFKELKVECLANNSALVSLFLFLRMRTVGKHNLGTKKCVGARTDERIEKQIEG